MMGASMKLNPTKRSLNPSYPIFPIRQSRALYAGALLVLCGIGGLMALGLWDARSKAREPQWVGMELEPLTSQMRAGLGLAPEQPGVYVSDVVGLAAQAGIREGDVIVGVDKNAVNDVPALQAVIDSASGAQRSVVVDLIRQGQFRTIILPPVPTPATLSSAAMIPAAAFIPLGRPNNGLAPIYAPAQWGPAPMAPQGRGGAGYPCLPAGPYPCAPQSWGMGPGPSVIPDPRLSTITPVWQSPPASWTETPPSGSWANVAYVPRAGCRVAY
jgi:membrane-associated protease RseP (regulator of RpoE activity)